MQHQYLHLYFPKKQWVKKLTRDEPVRKLSYLCYQGNFVTCIDELRLMNHSKHISVTNYIQISGELLRN